MKFIHFGCWNKGLCVLGNKDNDLSRVMTTLNTYVGSNRIDFIIVAGDNYYTPDKKDKKLFLSENLISGFNCLPRGLPKYILYGNHDVIHKHDPPPKCKTLRTQNEITHGKQDFIMFNDVQDIVIDSTIIIMFDSSLYDLDKGDEIKPKNETCYNSLFNTTPSSILMKDLIEYQSNKILDIILANSDKKNIILVAHHPLVCTKAEKACVNIKIIQLFRNLFEKLMEKAGSSIIMKKIYHLCADYHVYQQMNISIILNMRSPEPRVITITQYTAGTGGADLDEILTLDEKENVINTQQQKELFDSGVTYKIVEEEKVNGFLEVDVDREISFKFIKANEQKGGDDLYYNKYIKYKSKYLRS